MSVQHGSSSRIDMTDDQERQVAAEIEQLHSEAVSF
jgi:hypothetical protein